MEEREFVQFYSDTRAGCERVVDGFLNGVGISNTGSIKRRN